MEPFTPFASPYANGPPPWHHGGRFDRSFHDDSGYASEDSDIVQFSSSDPAQISEGTDQANRDSHRTRRHRAAVFVNAQWSRPAAFRAFRPLDYSFNDNPYDLPQPLSFEQQRNDYETGSRLMPTAFYNREDSGREAGHTAPGWDHEENIAPLNFEEHRARVPDDLPSLSNRIESETETCSLSSSSTRHEPPSPEAELSTPQFRASTTFAHPGPRTESSMRWSARRPCRDESPSRDVQLATAWRQLHQERTDFENEKRAVRKQWKVAATTEGGASFQPTASVGRDGW